MPDLIHDNSEVQLLHHPAPSAFTLVSFGPRGRYADGSYFWGEPIARKLGINTFGVMPKRANWYPEAFMGQVLDYIVAHAPARPLITYGASMGAFAAIKYAAKLNAAQVIAFTPQYSIDPKIMGEDDIFATNYVAALHDGFRVEPGDCDAPAYVFFDPFVVQDHRHREALHGVLGQAIDIDLPMCGHGCVEVFSSTELIGRLFDLCRAGDTAGIKALSQQARRTATVRRQTMATMLIKRHPAWGLRILEQHGAKMRPQVLAQIFFGLATALMDRRQFDLAETAIDGALRLEPGNANLARRRAQIMYRAARFPDAVVSGLAATEVGPADWLNHFELSRALLACRLNRHAAEALDQAEQLFKGDEKAFKLVANLRTAIAANGRR